MPETVGEVEERTVVWLKEKSFLLLTKTKLENLKWFCRNHFARELPNG
jgi:hypothetical protein